MLISVTLRNATTSRLESGDPTDGLLANLLREQHATAVDSFVRWHDTAAQQPHKQAQFYRDLIPSRQPNVGEQFGFEVDLDACSGCKACVVACHNLNGLDDDHTWRSVGLLHGGTAQLPVLQHVTTACHHCIEPACLDGCPVEAYEKDPITGIVRHLDDQCIGCQYCILKCPYDVPKFDSSRGIVRKCDMCSSRLAVGEAPACVQSCPNQAIRITVVDKHEIAENAEANFFLPGAPEPGYTLPSTVYKTSKAIPANLLPADYFSAAPQHAHWPLVVMLVLTQMSVGAFVVEQLMCGLAYSGGVVPAPLSRGLHIATALVLAIVGMGASVAHLGRPWLAYRAIIGWRTSWLSREVIAFGVFAALSFAYVLIAGIADRQSPAWSMFERVLGALVATSGIVGVGCSVMIYSSTRRVFWNLPYTGTKFILTCLVSGCSVALAVRTVAFSWTTDPNDAGFGSAIWGLSSCLIAATVLKLSAESAAFAWLGARTMTPFKRTALLLVGDLAPATRWRFACGVIAGVLLPGILLSVARPNAWTVGVAVAVLITNLAGELLERYLFFAAVVAPKMPGAPAT